ncbi:MAG: glutathione-dependent thiol reductase [Sphingobacteriaceae bacterium]|jgi:arsenate reductase|nr:glutathione-dependent thiol reductase [Sphingobacteriaceae bacterium]
MIKVYGIPNCNTVKKSLDWLKEHGLEYQFHDFKKLGIAEDRLKQWSQKLGWETLVNKRGTTWKQLDPATQQSITSEQAAFQLMQEKTSVIKRPVIEAGDIVLSGFDAEAYKKSLQ